MLYSMKSNIVSEIFFYEVDPIPGLKPVTPGLLGQQFNYYSLFYRSS